MKLEELQEQFIEETEEVEAAGEGQKEKKSRFGWIFLLFVVAVLAVTAILLKQKFRDASISGEDAVTAEGAIMAGLPEGMREGELGDALQQKIDDSMFTMNVNTQPLFKNGNSKGKIDIVNSPGNHFPCKVILTLDEDESELYRCDDLIYPEQYIHEIKLGQTLEKGVYPSTLTYYIYDEAGEKVTGIAKAGIRIVIQN